jgi:hypothetical protein
MSSVAVPKKMVPVPNVYGVEAFKELKPEMVALHPIQHKDTSFTTSSTNRISFKIPAYSNALMDTSRSFIHMQLSAAAESALAQGLPIFSRMTVKTSSGLTIEDVSDMDVLSHMLSFLKPISWEKASTYGNLVSRHKTTDSQAGILPATSSNNDAEAIFKFDWGVFDKKLTKFIPLFMADGGAGYSFDVDLYLSDIGLSVTGGGQGSVAVKKPVWYLQLMRMDEGLARRFNQMAVHGEEIRIPFTTYHTHNASPQATEALFYIHENATNFKKILTCVRQPNFPLIKYTSTENVQELSGMTGGVDDQGHTTSGFVRVDSYNYRVGVQHVYNEPIMEANTNTRTLQFVKQAYGIPDEVTIGLENLVPHYNSAKTQKIVEHDATTDTVIDRNPDIGSNIHQSKRWCAVASFDYSPGDFDVVQGISSSNPVELSMKFEDSPTGLIVMNFCELGYDLVFRGGAVHYEEQKPGSQSVY